MLASSLGREYQAGGRTRPRPRLGSLGEDEGGLRRRVIAGQGQGRYCLEGHYTHEIPVLSREEIEAVLPHRDPFLLLDEVVELEPGERVVARKRVRADEWYLSGHFPGRPIMPGVLIVEAMAQAGAVAVLSEEENRGKLALFAGIDGVRFKRVVEPGDELELTCDLERVRGPVGRGKATAKVDGQLAARGTLTFAVER